MSQYIGKTISLISVTDNRYIGLLEDVDSEKGTVTLGEVRCFGTEGRRNWGPEEIYPNPTVYNSVKFNGNEVKDLSILDCKLEDVQPMAPPAAAIPPPAVPAVSAAQLPQQMQQSPPQQYPGAQTSPPEVKSELQVQGQPRPQVPAAVAGYGVYAPAAPQNTATGKPKQFAGSQAANEPRAPKQRGNDQRRRTPNETKVEIPTEDFDFQSNNAKFAKGATQDVSQEDESNGAAAMEQEAPANGSTADFYNKKSSFFDSISTSTETNTNMKWQDEKEMNLDTFGQVSARPRFGNRGGFRGGRGRGRGRGRGGRGRGRGGNEFSNNNRSNFGSQQANFRDTEF